MRPLTDNMKTALDRIARGTAFTYTTSDQRTMRALERRALVRYSKRQDAWKLTAKGQKELTR